MSDECLRRVDSLSSPKSTTLRTLPNRRKSIRNNSNEQIEQPKVQYDHTRYEEERGDEELGVHHLVHDGRPAVDACEDDYLQDGVEDVVE